MIIRDVLGTFKNDTKVPVRNLKKITLLDNTLSSKIYLLLNAYKSHNS